MRTPALVVLAALSTSAVACEDAKKINEQAAVDELARLLPVVKEDVTQVRTGLPAGAAKLAALIEKDPDPANDPAGLQRNIAAARASSKELAVAKSTFFSFVDPTGNVLRSEANPDHLVGKNVFASFPSLKKAVEPTSGVVEAQGEMPEMRGVKNGPDLAWVVAHPVKGTDQVRGAFITGWSFRSFAYHLDEMAKRHLAEAVQKEGKKSSPICYVFAIVGDKAYGGPVTPEVDAQAVEGLKVVEKAANGPFRGSVEVTGRTFGVAAERVPELGDKAAIAVMVSEL